MCFFCVIPLAGTKVLCLFHPWVGGVSALREEVTIDNSKNNYALGTRSEIPKQSERVVQSEITRQKHNYVWDAEQRKWVPLKPDNSSQPYAGHMCDYKTTSNRLVSRYNLPFASCSFSYDLFVNVCVLYICAGVKEGRRPILIFPVNYSWWLL